MPKLSKEPPLLWEHFGHKKIPDVGTRTPLLPRPRRNPWPIIAPLLLIAGVIVAAGWAYLEFLAPVYEAEESEYSNNLAIAEEYEGETIKEINEGSCFELVFQRDNSLHSICVSEALWDEQEVNTGFDISLLREVPASEKITLW